MSSDFVIARILWKRGKPVPVDILTRLLAQGYDVAHLERNYNVN